MSFEFKKYNKKNIVTGFAGATVGKTSIYISNAADLAMGNPKRLNLHFDLSKKSFAIEPSAKGDFALSGQIMGATPFNNMKMPRGRYAYKGKEDELFVFSLVTSV